MTIYLEPKGSHETNPFDFVVCSTGSTALNMTVARLDYSLDRPWHILTSQRCDYCGRKFRMDQTECEGCGAPL